jgi:hypothetical protein
MRGDTFTVGVPQEGQIGQVIICNAGNHPEISSRSFKKLFLVFPATSQQAFLDIACPFAEA